MKYFSLHQQWVLFVLALLLLGILYFKFYYHPRPSPSEGVVRETVVEISGEVRNPEVYLFQDPPTLREAIEKAGGLKETAQFDSISSTEVLETGTLLTVTKDSPREFKAKLGRMTANKLLVFSIPLDLNRVSLEDLCLIPGIGESLAQEIIAYRERRRGFRSVDELKNIKGIGEKKYQVFKSYFLVTQTFPAKRGVDPSR
jgi:competence protein ComEA